jgi:hypothetical protein
VALAGALALGMGMSLSGCIGHYGFAMLPLPAEEGWFPLPTARWLLEGPVEPQTLWVCPREACPEPAFVAQLRLTGPDRALVARLAQDPAAFAASLKPTPRRNARREASSPAAPPRVVAPLAAGRWRGAVFRIESAKAPARAAHTAVLADAATGEVLLVVAQSSAAAERLARQALE